MGIRAPNLFTRKLGKSLGPAPLQVHITWTSIHPTFTPRDYKSLSLSPVSGHTALALQLLNKSIKLERDGSSAALEGDGTRVNHYQV